jgi:regulator of RNase E activity RraA
LDTCAVSDALDRLGLPGMVAGLRDVTGPSRVAGRVVTVRLEAAHGRTAERHLCTGAIDIAEPGQVVVVEHRSRTDCAGWGGILSRAAAHKGLSGVIVEGLCRDVDESRDFGFPTYARGAISATARGRIIETAMNEPILVGSVTVRAGDYVLADGSGVTFIAADHVKAVLERAEEIAAKEKELLAAVAAGVPVSAVMAGTYERMLLGDD